MGSRGAQPLEERIGVDRFKELLKRLSISDIARLYCEHEVDENRKAQCKACKRSIYRAKKRIEEKQRQHKRFDPMKDFDLIPEIQSYIAYEKAKGKKIITVGQLRTYWLWLKENPKLKELSRPILWDTRHIMFFLQKLKEKQIALYHPKESLRRFFESQNNPLQKHPLIRASRKDMRSPKGARRKITSFPPSMLPEIWKCVDSEERLAIDLHLTVKSREGDRGKGSLLNAQWNDINWSDTFYGFPMVTISIHEPKTKGGTWWRHCPLDLWFNDLSKRLLEKWEQLGKPEEGYILDFTYRQYRQVWLKVSECVGQKVEPHDCRRSPSGWLRDLGLSDLALGQYNPTTGEAIGYTGVGWENAEIFYQRYGKMNPQAIYKKELKLDAAIFDGSIHKILENR